jgi:tetratricopeptide (TPR) repeat protein
MNNKYIVFCLAFWLLLPSLAFAAPNKSLENTEFQIFKAQTELKLDGVKESQQRDLQLLQQQIEAQNKQIEGFDKRISDINLALQWYALIAGVLDIFVAVAAYYSAGSKAKESAEIWFNQNEKGLLDRLKKLEAELTAKAKQVHNNIDDADQGVQQHARNIIANNPLNSGATPILSADDKETLEKADTQLKEKPESQYAFDDWNTRAFAAYAENNLALAVEYWRKAVLAPDATDLSAARLLVNIGVTLNTQNKLDEAIACYNDVISRYGSSNEVPLRDATGRALINKGDILDAQGKSDAAIACYNEAIRYLGTSTETFLLESVARSLHNKGIVLDGQNKSGDAIACYDEIIERFGASVDAVLQASVAHALNGKGFIQLNLAKQDWLNEPKRVDLLNSALNFFEQSKINNPEKAIVLGNEAYALWLLGLNEKTKAPLREALTLGGEIQRDLELKDTETYTIEFVDAGFRELVNKIWDEIKSR